MKRFLFLPIFLLIAGLAFAQTAPPTDIVTIEQNLKKLDVAGSVLYVAAHPDDENTRLLAYLAQEKHYRTGYLSMTRGDGGQNLIGNEQGELLGLIRTQELLAARKVDGAEQFFTRALDFGFSKGPEETLNFWNKEKILGDVVWVIRKFRPDVIICRFPTTGEGGHGNHTASAILAQEAFTAAADPKRFPEQLKYVQTWQPKRLMWNTFNFGNTNTITPDQFKINVGVYNPLLGKGYGELAAESRSNHKTQGFGSARQRGDAYEYFKTILGDAPKTDLMDGVNTTWGRIKDGGSIGTEIEKLSKEFDANHPDKSVPALIKVYDRVQKIDDNYWREQKTKELSELIAACAGLWVESYAAEPTYALNDSIKVKTQVILRSNRYVKLESAEFLNRGWLSRNAIYGSQDSLKNTVRDFDIKIKADAITQPYWLKYQHSIGSYNTDYLDSTKVIDVLDDEPITQSGADQKTMPENVPYRAKLRFYISGQDIILIRPIEFKYTDPARGEIYQPLVVAPPVTANIQDKVYIFNSQQPQTVQVKLEAFEKIGSGTISLDAPPGWKISPERVQFTNKNKGDEWDQDFTVTPSGNKSQTGVLEATVTHDRDNTSYKYSKLSIHYNHIPNITLFLPAQAKLVQLDLKIAGKKIGYIDGAGDLVEDALREVGYQVHDLKENEILNGDLSVYDAIIMGVRAYNTNPRLAIEQPRLLEYVKNGGNLLVQYNNSNGLVTKNIGPYPFKVVNERVTDETAKITILDPNNPVLNYPNKITPADFDGWVQERGLYFTKDSDPQYQKVLQMADPGESPKDGALITTQYGKGRFIYTSLAFFRQLPAGVPGAYRLFINMINKPKASP